ncbi:Acyltransferase family protein [Thalassoglobus neptunius]|uniref:Acyltransferase family protein n=1 Tax=Thalassoglobus neptunius TaxID=1938619 RepID=A0A5C5X3M3_9PLAN|nr:acyltransferase [Thalassoglobus neptunius]TWT56732.1 Acyltransferase family protein [Thalassoglobus neptunius]
MGVLRTVLALAVLVVHTEPTSRLQLTGGMAAVQCFFMISGFYMALILEKKYSGPGGYKLFISNRILRLYPIYLVVLACTFLASLASYWLLDNPGKLTLYFEYWGSIDWTSRLYLVLTNVFLLGQDALFFSQLNLSTGTFEFAPDFHTTSPECFRFLFVVQAWTLSLELMFYLIAPFIVCRRVPVIIAITAASLALRGFVANAFGLFEDPWSYRFFPFELAMFLLGTLAYKLYSRSPAESWVQSRWRIPVIAVFALFILFYTYVPLESIPRRWVFYSIAFFAIPYLFASTRYSKLDAKIGEYSYPIYISHMLVLYSTEPFLRKLHLENFKLIIVAVATFLVSAALIRWISEPLEKVRQNRVALAKKNRVAVAVQ